MEMSRFLYEVGFVTLPMCPDVNANHPIERNYGNSVRFLAKIANGTAAESPCYSVFWNAIVELISGGCILLKNLNVGPANRPAFCRQVPLFYAKCPSKNILQVGRSENCCWRSRSSTYKTISTCAEVSALSKKPFNDRHLDKLRSSDMLPIILYYWMKPITFRLLCPYCGRSQRAHQRSRSQIVHSVQGLLS